MPPTPRLSYTRIFALSSPNCAPARDCSRCAAISRSKPSMSISTPFSAAISWVISTGKPWVSHSLKTTSPDRTSAPSSVSSASESIE